MGSEATDAITLITEDHRLLEGLCERLRTGDGDRAALVAEIAARLTAHARAEEEQVYPSIEEAEPDRAAEVDHAFDEHGHAEKLLRSVRHLTGSPHFEAALDGFVAAMRHHVAEEEERVLPALRATVDDATLERLGAEFALAREEHLRRAGFVDPDAATRAELYELAREAGVPGRSSMNKDELARALRQDG